VMFAGINSTCREIAGSNLIEFVKDIALQ
jgi:hypothetical protein